ncbi:MAG: H/ACA ribonucleoprotein complex subunit GAR1 [Archaeoglobaceae archaeon]
MKKLRELGVVQHVSKTGMIVVRLNPANIPKIGDRVVTKKLENVGVVQDVIGPVSAPYALVKPEKGVRIKDNVLYVVREYGGGGKGEGKGKGGRKGGRKERNRKGRGY